MFMPAKSTKQPEKIPKPVQTKSSGRQTRLSLSRQTSQENAQAVDDEPQNINHHSPVQEPEKIQPSPEQSSKHSILQIDTTTETLEEEDPTQLEIRSEKKDKFKELILDNSVKTHRLCIDKNQEVKPA